MATKTNTTINGKDYFRIQRVIGEKNGKPVRKSFYGKSKSDAESKYDKYKEQEILERYGKALTLDLSTLSDRAEEFIENTLKPSDSYAQGTIDRYVSAYRNHVANSSIANKAAYKIKASDIQKFYNNLDVSKQTLRQIHKFMSVFYKWMVRNEYAGDVLSAVDLPKKRDNKRFDDIVVWTDEEIESITENFGNYRYRFFIYILLYTGMRFSEVLGLKYSDITDNVIHVKRQCYQGEIKPPKANSVRDIPMHQILIDELDRHRTWHKREMQKNHYRTDYIFTTKTGNLIHRSSLDKSIRRYYERIGITPKHIHAYRSTFCTQLCKCGVSLEVASKLLGHKNIQVTARHYALVQPETKKEAIDLFHY